MEDLEPQGHEPLEEEGIPDLDSTLPEKEATGDAQEGVMAPRDRPRGAEQHGTTPEEQRAGEGLEDRIAQEIPSRRPAPRDEGGRLVEDDEGAASDTEDELVARDADQEEEGLSSEEAAVRVQPDAPGGTSDETTGYVEEP